MASAPERSGVVRDGATGEMIIPASQRPDGTWRKPRRVKDGYIPQEEVPTFQTKGNQWRATKPDHPIGLSTADLDKVKKKKQAQIEASTNAAVRAKNVNTGLPVGLSKAHVEQQVDGVVKSKGAKRREKRQNEAGKSAVAVEPISKDIAGVKISSSDENVPTETSLDEKKIRALKKKLRQIEELEGKINSGEVKEPSKDQLDKVTKKQSVIDELKELELKVKV